MLSRVLTVTLAFLYMEVQMLAAVVGSVGSSTVYWSESTPITFPPVLTAASAAEV